MAKECPLCAEFDDGPPVRKSANREAVSAECVRCGTFSIEHEVGGMGLSASDKLRLSCIARIASDGGGALAITTDNFRQLIADAPVPPTFGAYVDRLFKTVVQLCGSPGRSSGSFSARPIAALLCLETVACVRLLNDLREAEFILLARPHIDALNVSLTLKGVERADAVTRLRPQEENAFVAMWFDPVMDPAYEAMKRALEACGYDGPFRVSDPDHDKTVDGPDYTPKIDDRIMAGIRRARFIIADATGARPAVYYEAGFAEGLGTPIIWTCKKDSAKDDPTFDTRQLEHIFWTDENDLEEKLKAKIQRRGWNRRVG